ncbi:MAG: hypothetical protein HKN07_02325 [Acidimicrobiia bacterium]|nr:hypothetical protein [Acidimicrobiia bacterium]
MGRALIALVLVIAACGSGETGEAVAQGPVGTPDEPRVISVRASEFRFDPDAIGVADGETITFEVTNSGSILHEFQLASAIDVANHGEGGDPPSTEKLSLRPGERGAITVTIDDAAFQFVCFVTGHYEAGMWGEFTIP